MRSCVGRKAWLAGLIAALGLLAPVATARAQQAAQPPSAASPGFGDSPSAESSSGDQGPSDAESSVGYIDSALVRNQFRLRFDTWYQNHRPTRAEFLYVKNGLPFTHEPTPETNLNNQELSAYIEAAVRDRFSVFLDLPFRWADPTVNLNESGLADVSAGFKWAFISSSELTTTFMLRGTMPTRIGEWISTYHWSLEPGLLVNYQPMEYVTFEGELRYWTALGGSDFAGDFVRYGLGVAVGRRCDDDFWITPVVEFVGWTLLSGKELVVFPAGNVGVKSSGGETIFNAKAGVRAGWGKRGDVYLGYGHALTGDVWYKDIVRVELRVFY